MKMSFKVFRCALLLSANYVVPDVAVAGRVGQDHGFKSLFLVGNLFFMKALFFLFGIYTL
jgi:hypothetical protein